MARRDAAFITRVVIQNYKSIAWCDVRLGPLTFLVGLNGAGKSNFIDALRFVADGLNTTLDHAIRERGGINELRHRFAEPQQALGIRLDFQFGPEVEIARGGHLAFGVVAGNPGGFAIRDEECSVYDSNGVVAGYRIHDGVYLGKGETQPEFTNPPHAIPPAVDRLNLGKVSGLPPFRPAFDSLSRMSFYNLQPDSIRAPQSPNGIDVLARDGNNLASVLGDLAERDPDTKERLEHYLRLIAPGITAVDRREYGPWETVEFVQQSHDIGAPARFVAANMSDGTLRALGILVALFDAASRSRSTGLLKAPLVAIEEPEIALHPAAAGIMLASLRDASHDIQVLVTTHSPDLLDDKEVEVRSILAVVAEDGVTKIGPVDAVGRSVLRDRLFTSGELLRINQLLPSSRAIPRRAHDRLFDVAVD